MILWPTVAMASCIVWHELPKEFDWLGFLRCELVEWDIVSLLVVHMACSQYRLHQSPIPVGFIDILAPVLFDGIIGSTEVITWNSWRNMVWDMHIYVMAKDLNPLRVVTMNCAI